MLLNSCSEKRVLKVDTEILFSTNTSLTKGDFKELVKPFEFGTKAKTILVSYPLHINRVDLDNRVNLDYLTNKAVNYEKISPIMRDFDNYFKANEISPTLSEQSGGEANTDIYLKMPNCFVYSDKMESGNSIQAKKIFHDIQELKTEISQYVEKNKGKILILYYSPNAQHTVRVENPVESGESTTTASPKTLVARSPDNTQSQRTTNEIQVTASSLEDHFAKLANPNIPYSNKNGLKKSIQKFFTSGAQIVEVNNLGQALVSGKTVLNYAEHLCSTTKTVEIKDRVMSGDKISVLKIQEE